MPDIDEKLQGTDTYPLRGMFSIAYDTIVNLELLVINHVNRADLLPAKMAPI